MELSWNASALSLTIGFLFALIVAYKAYLVSKATPSNHLSSAFFGTMAMLTLYIGIRAIAALFFAQNASGLTIAYIVSHIFLGVGLAYLVKFGIIATSKYQYANSGFFITIILFAGDIVLNILYPNKPTFNFSTNLIEWGTAKPVAITHTILLFGAFLTTTSIFAVKMIQSWHDPILRFRSLFITMGLVVAILIVVPRNLFQGPFFVLLSDLGFVLAFALVLWGVMKDVARQTK